MVAFDLAVIYSCFSMVSFALILMQGTAEYTDTNHTVDERIGSVDFDNMFEALSHIIHKLSCEVISLKAQIKIKHAIPSFSRRSYI